MDQRKSRIATVIVLGLLLMFSAAFMLWGGLSGGNMTANAATDVSGYELADTVYDFTFTDSAAFASKWGAQAVTVQFNHYNRTMQIAAGEQINGATEMGSYHTKFDIKFSAGTWFSMYLRQNSGAERELSSGDYKATKLDLGANRGYRIFMQSQYLQFMETDASGNNGITNTAPIDSVNPLGSEKWYTFEIWVLNLKDGSVQFIVNVDGTTYINKNTKDITNSKFTEPLTSGSMRIEGSGVATEYRGYDSDSARSTELFTPVHFENWTGNGGEAGSAPMSWTNGGYTIGAFDTKAGWPTTNLNNATTLLGSDTVGGFSTRFTFKGNRVVVPGEEGEEDTVVDPHAANPYSLQLAYLEPGVKRPADGLGAGFLNKHLSESGWVNGYTVRLNLQSNTATLIRSNTKGDNKQVYWTNKNIVNFADGEEHTFYWSVKNAPNRSYQIVTLEVDGHTIVDYHSGATWSAVNTGITNFTDEEIGKFSASCPVGSFQIGTQAITGTFTGVGDKEFAQNYFVTDMRPVANHPEIATGITLENGVLTVPRGDKNSEDGTGYHWQEQVPVVTGRKISANSVIAFDFSATPINEAGKTVQLIINTNNELQYPTTGTKYRNSASILMSGSSSYWIGGSGDGFYGGTSILDGETHRVVITSRLTDSGLALQFFADGKRVIYFTYADNSYLHDGYFNLFAQGLDDITISNLTVYEDMTAATGIRLLGTPKTDYTVGDDLDVTSLSVYAEYKDGTHEEVAVTEEMVSGFDNENPSDAMTLTVAYAGHTVTFDVVMDAGNLPHYSVQEGYQATYSVGEAYAGDIVVIKKFEGVDTPIPVTADMLGNTFDTSLGGEVTLTVTVEGQTVNVKIFVQKELTGIEVGSEYKNEYDEGETFDYNNLKGKLNLTYNDGTSGVADITPTMLSQRVAYEGTNNITVSYGGYTATLVMTGTGVDAWDNDGDGVKRAALTPVNIADASRMTYTSFSTLVGNTIAFGPSIGEFCVFGSAQKYDAYRMEFDMMIPSNAANANQRILLRSSVVANNGINGYYLLIYKGNLQLYRRPVGCENSSGYRIGAVSFTEAMIGSTDIYDNMFHHVAVESFIRDNGLPVFNIAIDGVHVLHCVDTGTQTATAWENVPIPEADRKVYAEDGFVGFTMNSAGAAWILRGNYTDASFAPDTFLGNETLYDANGTAEATAGSVLFASGHVAFSADEVSILNTQFDLTVENAGGGSDILFALAPMTGKTAVTSYDTADGWIVKFYADRADITLDGDVLASVDGFDLAVNNTVAVKLSLGTLSGDSLIGLSVNGKWAGAAVDSEETNTSGYFGLYAFASVELTAERVAQRNFRILFVGNSITNHGSNKDLGYGIGDGADSWGMATSAPEYDYVHRVMAAIRAIPGYENAECLAINVANWEREYATYDFTRYYASGAAFEPDLIIGRVGENAQSCTASYIRANNFTHYYNKLLTFFNSKGTAQIVLTTSYWGDEHYDRDSSIDARIVELARTKDYPLVRLGDLGSKYKAVNNASADEEYYKQLAGNAPGGWSWHQEWSNWTANVKTHPGMVGMEAIAARISECVTDLLTGGTGKVFRYEEVSDGLFAEYHTSDLAGGTVGAYDFAKLTTITVSDFGDASAYTFADNYKLYKAYAIQKTGDLYRLSLPLDANVDASFTFKVYTLSEGTLSEVYYYTNTESDPEPVLAVDGTAIGTALFVTVEYNPAVVFPDKKLSDHKYGNLLKWINADSDTFVLDVSELQFDDLLIAQSMFGTVISAGKDIEIRFTNGTIGVEIDTFEAMAQTENDLYFSVAALSGNFLRAATNAVKALDETYTFISQTEEGYVNEVYETQISYNNHNGDALYLNKGVRVNINVTLTQEQVEKLVVITATLPAIGSAVTCVDVLDPSAYSYENGVLTLTVKDFDCDVILALGDGTVEPTPTATLTLKEGYKTEYEVGDELSVEGMTLVYTPAGGTATEVAVTAEMVSGFTTETAGPVEITVTYEGLSVTAEITVKEKTEPTPTATLTLKDGYKTQYEVGDALSVEGMTLVYTPADGTATEVAVTAEMVSGFTTETAGTVEITVTYEGLTVKAQITVKEKTEPAPAPQPEEKKCGCGSDVDPVAASAASVLLFGAAIVLCARKRKQAK